MRKNLLFGLLFLGSFIFKAQAQNFGYFASAVWMKDSTYGGFFNTDDTTGANAISNNPYINFDTTSLGTFPQNSGSLTINGAEIKTFKTSSGNVCGAVLYFTVYPAGNRPADPLFTPINLAFYSNCTNGVFDVGGGPCTTGDQKWHTVSTANDLTTFSPGNYTLEVYYQIAGSNSSASACGDTTYDNNGGSNYTTAFTITDALPVTLLNFSGSYKQAAVALTWTVAEEVNEKGFEVDRSIDGQSFSAVSFVNAKGDNAGQLSYSYNDNKLPHVNKVYYRLKMVDDDGKPSYSSILPLTIGTGGASTQFTAQLSSNVLTVHLTGALGNNSIVELTDMEGKTILKKKLAAQAQSSVVIFPLNEDISNGMYIVSVYDGATGNMMSNKVEANY